MLVSSSHEPLQLHQTATEQRWAQKRCLISVVILEALLKQKRACWRKKHVPVGAEHPPPKKHCTALHSCKRPFWANVFWKAAVCLDGHVLTMSRVAPKTAQTKWK